MRIAILSDVHGNKEALLQVLEDCKQLCINQFIFLGDLVIKGPSPKEVFDLLKVLDLICWVRGNTDDWFNEIDEDWTPSNSKEEELYSYFKYAKSRLSNEDIEIIKNKPQKSTIQIGEVRVLCVHGSPRKNNERMDLSVSEENLHEILDGVTEEIILCGHSHIPCNLNIDKKIIFNVGSIGNPWDGRNEASYGIVELQNDEVRLIQKRVSYAYNVTIAVAHENEFPYIDKYEYWIKSGNQE